MANAKKKGATVVAPVQQINRDQMVLRLAEAKNSVISRFNSIETAAAEKIGEVEFLDSQIEARRAGLADLGIVLEHAEAIDEIAAKRAAAEAEHKMLQVELAAARSREAAEFKYNLERQRKIEAEAHEDQVRERNRKDADLRSAVERELAAQRVDLAEREAQVERREEEAEDRTVAAEGRVDAAVAAAVAAHVANARLNRDEELAQLRQAVELLNAQNESDAEMMDHLRKDLAGARDAYSKLQDQVGNIALKAVDSSNVKEAARSLIGDFVSTQGGEGTKGRRN